MSAVQILMNSPTLSSSPTRGCTPKNKKGRSVVVAACPWKQRRKLPKNGVRLRKTNEENRMVDRKRLSNV